MKVLRSLLASLAFGALVCAVHPVGAEPPRGKVETVRLHVEGMTCGGCAAAVRVALGRVDGVRKVEVSFEEKAATVVYDPAKTTPEALVEAVEKLGYGARVDGGG
ncbi:MAG: hypothetical protein KatS3mg076_0883 [Candidatus Binatia bacterium]|nr:MAG: hypothetical protein KatS3mg076_0883 [Candidatus Binatia bacterium]